MPKSKPRFKILELKSFIWHLEIWKNQIESILKFEIIFFFKSEKWFCTLPPQLKMPPAPLPPGKKINFCTLPPQLIMPPAPLPPGKKIFFLHPATSIDNVPCCKNTILLSHFIQFQHYGEKETLAYREMKLLLPGGRGAGGIIN